MFCVCVHHAYGKSVSVCVGGDTWHSMSDRTFSAVSLGAQEMHYLLCMVISATDDSQAELWEAL